MYAKLTHKLPRKAPLYALVLPGLLEGGWLPIREPFARPLHIFIRFQPLEARVNRACIGASYISRPSIFVAKSFKTCARAVHYDGPKAFGGLSPSISSCETWLVALPMSWH